MKISVITWDGSFREHFHTVDCFGRQNFDQDYEFIWVDFYKNENPLLKEKLEKYPNFKLITLDNPPTLKWHIGACLNAGIKEAKGDLLIIPDGDIMVDDNFMQVVAEEHQNLDDLVLYFRRWDEPKEAYHPSKSYQIEHLEKVGKLYNPANHDGTIAIKKSTLEKVNLYEEHEAFAGAGGISRDLNIRLVNAACMVKWHHRPIYHPYHPFTQTTDKLTQLLLELARKHKWVIPYCGLAQSWILERRFRDLATQASQEEAEKLLEIIPLAITENGVVEKKKSLWTRGVGRIKREWRNR